MSVIADLLTETLDRWKNKYGVTPVDVAGLQHHIEAGRLALYIGMEVRETVDGESVLKEVLFPMLITLPPSEERLFTDMLASAGWAVAAKSPDQEGN